MALYAMHFKLGVHQKFQNLICFAALQIVNVLQFFNADRFSPQLLGYWHPVQVGQLEKECLNHPIIQIGFQCCGMLSRQLELVLRREK
jgi:hypothetical protein